MKAMTKHEQQQAIIKAADDQASGMKATLEHAGYDVEIQTDTLPRTFLVSRDGVPLLPPRHERWGLEDATVLTHVARASMRTT